MPHDRDAYARRGTVERFWARDEGLTRRRRSYDRTASSYRSGILLAATLDRLEG